jgi:hypothetical protein
MIDQSERLRRMTEYNFHMLRADQEHDRAAHAADRAIRTLHTELALLHEIAAADLTEAWRPGADSRPGLKAAREAYQAALAES